MKWLLLSTLGAGLLMFLLLFTAIRIMTGALVVPSPPDLDDDTEDDTP